MSNFAPGISHRTHFPPFFTADTERKVSTYSYVANIEIVSTLVAIPKDGERDSYRSISINSHCAASPTAGNGLQWTALAGLDPAVYRMRCIGSRANSVETLQSIELTSDVFGRTKKNDSCKIENFVESHLCKLRVILVCTLM